MQPESTRTLKANSPQRCLPSRRGGHVGAGLQSGVPGFSISPPIPVLHYHLSIHRFHNHRDSLPATNARGSQSIPQIIPSKLIENGNHQTRAGSTQRMPQRNSPAVHIRLVAIQPQHFLHRQILRRKRFIHLHAVDLLECQPRELQRLLR